MFYLPPGINQRTISRTPGPGTDLNGFAFAHSISFLISAVGAEEVLNEDTCNLDEVTIRQGFGTITHLVNIMLIGYLKKQGQMHLFFLIKEYTEYQDIF